MRINLFTAGLTFLSLVLTFTAVDSHAWTISSQVFDATGVPVEDATVSLFGSATCPLVSVTITLTQTTDVQGAAAIREVPDGCFQMEASHPTLGTVRQRVGAITSDISGIRLELPGRRDGFEGWSIGGVVCREDGTPIPAADVLMIGFGEEGVGSSESTMISTDNQGRFRFDRVMALGCEIHAIAEGRHRVVSRWSESDGDQLRLRLTLPSLEHDIARSTVSGRVTDASGTNVGGARIALLGMIEDHNPPEVGVVVRASDEGYFTAIVPRGANYGVQAYRDGLGMTGTPLGMVTQEISDVSVVLPGRIFRIGVASVMITPVRIDFNGVERGVGKRLPVTITNSGQTPVVISGQRIYPPGGDGGCGGPACVPNILSFYVSMGGGGDTLAPGDLHTTSISCYPYNYGEHAALFQINFRSPESNSFQIPLNAFTLGVQPRGGMTPDNFSVSEVYPNPFNNSASIAYNLPRPQNVTLDILDLCGRSVTRLIDGERPAGQAVASWNAANVPMGIYYARLQSGPQISTMKLVLVK
jgi:hypothetical protein